MPNDGSRASFRDFLTPLQPDPLCPSLPHPNYYSHSLSFVYLPFFCLRVHFLRSRLQDITSYSQALDLIVAIVSEGLFFSFPFTVRLTPTKGEPQLMMCL